MVSAGIFGMTDSMQEVPLPRNPDFEVKRPHTFTCGSFGPVAPLNPSQTPLAAEEAEACCAHCEGKSAAAGSHLQRLLRRKHSRNKKEQKRA